MRPLQITLAAFLLQTTIDSTPVAGQTEADHSFYTVVGYDETADPFEHLELTKERALHEGKRILLQVGGEWCGWCHRLDQFIQDHPAILEKLSRDFLIMKVTWTWENQNKPFLSQYPEIPGYPHIYVLEGDGTFLHSQGTLALEERKSYNEQAILDFLEEWAPGRFPQPQPTPEGFTASSDSAAAMRAQMIGWVRVHSDTLLIALLGTALHVPDSLLGASIRMVTVHADDCVGGMPVLGTKHVAFFVDWKLSNARTVITETSKVRVPLPALGARSCKLYFELRDGRSRILARLMTLERLVVSRAVRSEPEVKGGE